MENRTDIFIKIFRQIIGVFAAQTIFAVILYWLNFYNII